MSPTIIARKKQDESALYLRTIKMKSGDSVLEEEPYCHVLLQKHRGALCDRCFTRVDTLKKCTGCGVLWYCDKSCQKRDWTVHKLECKCLKQVLPKIPMDSVRMMLRLIITKSRNLPMNSPWSRNFDDLMTRMYFSPAFLAHLSQRLIVSFCDRSMSIKNF
ncbi:histone-lysine N-methyltransferase SMYD3-like [Mercenaria mercenaria]|uniref:histone-lysine N-methyltransferase SMYD3-like n=1 Tax=Mercenaria mercenaria TaxID=6596 RepID=UPI00234F3A72|nr:histone-lysine N-methyltransferase SMYD3-like [Mercenaria mercenaria]